MSARFKVDPADPPLFQVSAPGFWQGCHKCILWNGKEETSPDKSVATPYTQSHGVLHARTGISKCVAVCNSRCSGVLQ